MDKLYFIFDEQGNFITQNYFSKPPKGGVCIEDNPIIENFIKIKYDWQNLCYYEGATPEEIAEATNLDNGSLYDLFVTTLTPGDKIEYQEGQGFKVLTNNGSIKTSLNQGNNPLSSVMQSIVTSTDVVNNNAVADTMADITGLSFNVLAGNRYYFKFVINYSSAANTTGARFSISGPTSPFSLNYTSEYSLTATTTTRNANNISYDLPAASNASSAQAITFGGNLAIIEGFIIPSADGTVIGRFASEVANSAITAKAGSVVYYQQLT